MVSRGELWNNDSLDRAKLVQFEGKLEASTYWNGSMMVDGEHGSRISTMWGGGVCLLTEVVDHYSDFDGELMQAGVECYLPAWKAC